MAEQYGTRPKMFTKSWWSWYWMYHKGITLGAIFAIILIVITVNDYLTKEKFDVTLTFAGSTACTDAQQEKIEEILSPLCEDLDENGEKSLYFSHIFMDYNSNDVEYVQATTLKLTMAIGEEETYLFIVDEEVAERYLGENKDDAAFAPLKDWVTADISGLETYDAHGESFGIDVSTLDIFKEAGITQPGYYMFVRYSPREDQSDQKAGYESSIRLANKFLEYKTK